MKLPAPTVSLRAKIILMVAGTLVAAIFGTSVLIRSLVYDNIVKNKMRTVDLLTLSLLHDVKTHFDEHPGGDPGDVFAKFMTYYRIIQGINYYNPELVNAASSDRARIGEVSQDPVIVAAIQKAKPSLEVTRRDWKNLGIRSTAPILKGSRIVGAIDLDVSIEDVEATLSAIDRRIATILVVAVLISSITLLFLLRKTVLTRLANLIDVTQQIAGGNYNIRVHDDQKDELGELAQAFNRMTTDLQASAEKLDRYNKHLEEMVRDATQQLQVAYEDLKNAQRQLIMNEKMASLGVLIAGVAHEINTPVGSIMNVARHMDRKIAQLPGALADLQKNGEISAPALVACLEDVLAASRAPRRAATLSETRELARALEESGVRDPSHRAPVLAKLNFMDPTQVARHVGVLDSASAFAFVDLCGGIAQAAQISETSSQRIMEIVRALKLYAYSDDAKVESTQINDSIQTALVILRHQLKEAVRITADLEPSLPPIPCTSDIHQVWTNLLNNALDAVSEMGNPHVGEIVIRTRRSDERITVTVVDNGAGIADTIIDKVFDPFFTTKDIGKGTGLGLCIVSGIVRKHGGDIRVKSSRGETAFEVTLPISGGASQAAKDNNSGLFAAVAVEQRAQLLTAKDRGE